MSAEPEPRWRRSLFYVFALGLPSLFLCVALYITRENPAWYFEILLPATVAGAGVTLSLKRLDHVKLPSWVGPTGMAVVIGLTTVAQPSSKAWSVALAVVAGLMSTALIFGRRRRGATAGR